MTPHALPCSPASTAPTPTAGAADASDRPGVAGLRLHTAARHRALEALVTAPRQPLHGAQGEIVWVELGSLVAVPAALGSE